jgi:hypothetical protein
MAKQVIRIVEVAVKAMIAAIFQRTWSTRDENFGRAATTAVEYHHR